MANRVHWSLWVVGLFGLLWSAGGLMNLFMQMSPEGLAKMPESHQAIAKARPFWATIAFAESAFCGILGCLALLFRHRISGPLLFLSLLGTLIAVAQAVFEGGALEVFKGAEFVLAVIGPVVVSLFLVVFAHRARKRGWLRGTAVE